MYRELFLTLGQLPVANEVAFVGVCRYVQGRWGAGGQGGRVGASHALRDRSGIHLSR